MSPKPPSRRAAACAIAVAAGLWSPYAAADCQSAADCSEGRVCQEGRCLVTPGAAESQDVHRLDSSRTAAKFLTIGGVAALGTGYLMAAVGAGVGLAIKGSEDSKYGGSCGTSAPLSFIPLVGPFLTAGNYPNYQIAAYGQGSPYVLDCHSAKVPLYTLATIDEVFQIGGLGMLVAGLVVHATVIARTEEGTLEVLPGTASAPLGVTLRFVKF